MKRISKHLQRSEAKPPFTQTVLLNRMPLHCLATESRKVLGLDMGAELL